MIAVALMGYRGEYVPRDTFAPIRRPERIGAVGARAEKRTAVCIGLDCDRAFTPRDLGQIYCSQACSSRAQEKR